jgi:hypothetical protein
MPKPPNLIGSESITVTTTPYVRRYLEQLVKGGLYGKNAAEAAERLISRSIEELIKQGSLRALKNPSKK